MLRVWIAAIVCCQLASAAILDLTANNVSWDGVGPSPTMTVGVFNADFPDLERMLGWQMTLQVVPQGGSSGTVTFGTPASSPPFAPAPPAYVLAGQSAGIISINTASQIRLADDDPTLVGVTVPPAGATFMNLTFLATVGSLGLFDIVAVAGLANTSWSDDNFNDRAFNNVPFAGPSLFLATVEVIPEPSSIALISLFVVGVAAWRVRRLACRTVK